MGQHPGRALTVGEDSHCKYQGTDRFDVMQCCLIGSCISPSRLTGTAKARAGGSNNLQGIVADGQNMYRYLQDNGAEIACLDFNVPATPAKILNGKVKSFLQSPGNNKLLYLTGHGNTAGDICVEGGHICVYSVFGWLGESGFCGHLTIVVDACYSGNWAKKAHKYIHSPCRSTINKAEAGSRVDLKINTALLSAAERARQKTYINLRCSSLSSECSRDSNDGGVYTKEFIWCLRREGDWVSQTGPGWGTRVLTERRPNEQDCFWTTSTSEAQTDVTLDLVIHPDGCTTTAHYPESRAKYVQ